MADEGWECCHWPERARVAEAERDALRSALAAGIREIGEDPDDPDWIPETMVDAIADHWAQHGNVVDGLRSRLAEAERLIMIASLRCDPSDWYAEDEMPDHTDWLQRAVAWMAKGGEG